jgi:hypothetical protein
MKTPEHVESRCALHGVNILLGNTASENLDVSLRHAAVIERTGKFTKVIYLNLAFEGRRWYAAEREVFGKEKKKFTSYHIGSGNLARNISSIMAGLGEKDRPAIIINSWEMASSCYRYREALIFLLHQLVMIYDAAIYIYAQAKPESVIKGYTNRAGFGRLTIVTHDVIDLVADRRERAEHMKKATDSVIVEAKKIIEEPLPAVAVEEKPQAPIEGVNGTSKEVPKTGESAQLPARKINSLRNARGHLSAVTEQETDKEEYFKKKEVYEGVLEYA